MNRWNASIRLVAVVAALGVTALFVRYYGQTSYVNLKWYYCTTMPKPGVTFFDREINLPVQCEFLLTWSPYFILLPILVGVIGVAAIICRRELLFTVVLETGWLVIITLICFTVFIWAVPWTPGTVSLAGW